MPHMCHTYERYGKSAMAIIKIGTSLVPVLLLAARCILVDGRRCTV